MKIYKNQKIKFVLLILLISSLPLNSYVGPGAGFAFAGSFLFIFIAFFLALYYFLTFPFRTFIKFLKRIKVLKQAKFKKVIVVGYDGMDYNLLKEFIKNKGDFPNFNKLAESGAFAPLLSTEPPVSPVAWSTFATGVNPGKHNIFDFLSSNRRNYMPELSCSEILPPKRSLKLGKYQIPLSKSKIVLKRKSKAFWNLIGKKGLYSSVLRVPYTFPPEKLYGVMLSGLGTPDLRGSQGSSTHFSSEKYKGSEISNSIAEQLKPVNGDNYEGFIQGPDHPFLKEKVKLKTSFKIKVMKETDSVEIIIGKERIELKKGVLSDWNKIEFKTGLIKVKGIVQWYVKNLDPLEIYLSPINIDPENPSMPISYPKIFSVYLSRLFGPYATLGMAEDTWAVEEDVITEDAFIDQVYHYQREREKTFFDTLKKYQTGLVVAVFEATDRIQHIFWRYLKDSGSKARKESKDQRITDSIYRVYKDMDRLTGEILKEIKKNELLLIVSDHGFNTVRREFDLNAWLKKEGYLVLNNGKKESGKFYADVDWSKTKAYGQGLNGLYLNIKGREKSGIVNNDKEADDLKTEIQNKLLSLKDPDTKENIFERVYQREEVYKGAYVKNAPDIVLGYNVGYKVSWESAVNFVGNQVHKDSKRLWSGDHCFHNEAVKGIFLSNVSVEEKDPRLLDISPTVLSAFGIKRPGFIEGKTLTIDRRGK